MDTNIKVAISITNRPKAGQIQPLSTCNETKEKAMKRKSEDVLVNVSKLRSRVGKSGKALRDRRIRLLSLCQSACPLNPKKNQFLRILKNVVRDIGRDWQHARSKQVQDKQLLRWMLIGCANFYKGEIRFVVLQLLRWLADRLVKTRGDEDATDHTEIDEVSATECK